MQNSQKGAGGMSCLTVTEFSILDPSQKKFRNLKLPL